MILPSIDFSSVLFFALDFTEFIIDLVSWPVYATTPYTYSVLRRLHPLKQKLKSDIGIVCPSIVT